MEGEIELSLGCLKCVINRRERDRLEFPLFLQVLDSKNCLTRERVRREVQEPRQLVTVSDGFYKRTDCFIVNTPTRIEPYSIIRVKNIDFGTLIERDGRNGMKIMGHILDFDVEVTGSSIGYFSGVPISLDQYLTGAVDMRNTLSDKLWRQVKEGKCCDVTFKFSLLPGEPTLQAQKNALIAHSDVFEAQFEGGYMENSGHVQILDSEPRYMKSLIQFIFTQFVPLISLSQAFQVLYLAKKYMMVDLEKFCRNFIVNNKDRQNRPRDIFKYMELNQKVCDDEVHAYVLQEFARHTNVFLRQPAFLELSLGNVETFLSLPRLNAHEWEILQALRRWAIYKGVEAAQCSEDRAECLHQLLDCIRWRSVPLKEGIMVNSWPEFSLHEDRDFLSQWSEPYKRPQEIHDVVPLALNLSYSLNRRFNNRSNFVVYTNLALDLGFSEQVECLHGVPLADGTRQATGCTSTGPPFELQGANIIPCYGVEKYGAADVKIKVVLCQDSWLSNRHSDLETSASLRLFSFKQDVAALRAEFKLKFANFRYSHCSMELTLSKAELQNYIYSWQGRSKVVDLQIRFSNEDPQGRVHTVYSQRMPRNVTSKQRRGEQTDKHAGYASYNIMSGVGPILRRLREQSPSPPRSPREKCRSPRYRYSPRSSSREEVLQVETPDFTEPEEADSPRYSALSVHSSAPYSPLDRTLLLSDSSMDSEVSHFIPTSPQSPQDGEAEEDEPEEVERCPGTGRVIRSPAYSPSVSYDHYHTPPPRNCSPVRPDSPSYRRYIKRENASSEEGSVARFANRDDSPTSYSPEPGPSNGRHRRLSVSSPKYHPRSPVYSRSRSRSR